MTTFDATRSTTGARFGGMISSFFGAFADWNDARITRKSLSRLSARELDDIGLVRGDIDLIAARGTRY